MTEPSKPNRDGVVLMLVGLVSVVVVYVVGAVTCALLIGLWVERASGSEVLAGLATFVVFVAVMIAAVAGVRWAEPGS